jgi:hypothetical protein
VANFSQPTTGLTSGVSTGALANWYALNGLLNQFDTTTVGNVSGNVIVSNGTGFDDRALLSTDIPGIVVNAQTGTSYTLVLADAGKLVERNNASANTLTVPPNSSVAFPVGTIIAVSREGAGTTTIVAGSGVTIQSEAGRLSIAAQYNEVALRKRGTDDWRLVGALS